MRFAYKSVQVSTQHYHGNAVFKWREQLTFFYRGASEEINEHEQRYITQMFELGNKDVRDLGPDIVVLTLGSKGCKIFSDDGEKEIGPIPTALVDPTGAGDSFAAGFLVGYSKGYSLEKCARIGAAVASVTISTREAHPEVSWGEIEGLISRTD